jgi:hypothetical protein
MFLPNLLWKASRESAFAGSEMWEADQGERKNIPAGI